MTSLLCPSDDNSAIRALSGGVCWLDNSKSPPSRLRAFSAMPARIEAAIEPTAPMAATPNIRAARKTLNLATEPRISGRANCHARRQLTGTPLLCSGFIG